MHYRIISRLLGGLVLIIGISMVFALIWAGVEHEHESRQAILISMLTCLGLGIGLVIGGRGYRPEGFLIREGLATVALGWILAAVLGAMPFYLSGFIPDPIDAFFESMSGFTTTGSSILTQIEGSPKSLLFWRSFTHWLGGIGIIVLFIAILPQMGVGARHLFRSEIPGAVKKGISPRIKDTALYLVAIYIAMSVALLILLLTMGMTLFDGLCHVFGTVATGGFSTYNNSIAHYDSVAIEVTIIIFMILAGTNFSLYFLMLRRQTGEIFRDAEWRTYIGLMILATILITIDLIQEGSIPNPAEALRYGAFQAAAIQTTTGYVTADWDQWGALAKGVLLALMFIGGCSGSTAGGMKVMRIIVLVKFAYIAVYHWFRPHAVVSMKIKGKTIKNETVQGILGYYVLFTALYLFCTIIMAMMDLDLVTASSAVIATMGNIGPGLGMVGAASNYSEIPAVGKLVLSVCMLLGRLEFFTLLVLFVPSFWKR